MIWIILSIVFILGLALAIRKASKGTAFAHKCPCTPYIEHLRGVENEKEQVHKKENLW